MHKVTDTFADRVKLAAGRKGIDNNAELARFLGVNPQTAHNWWNGTTTKPSAIDVYRAADKLSVSARWLATGYPPIEAEGILSLGEAQLLRGYRRLADDEKELVLGIVGKIAKSRAGEI